MHRATTFRFAPSPAAAALPVAVLILAGCPTSPCPSQPELELGSGNGDSGFLPLHDGDDVVMWQVRHPWNRQVQVSLRAFDLTLPRDDDGDEAGAHVEVGLYQDGALVAGMSIADAMPVSGPGGALDFLGLRAQVVTDDYEPLSGLPTAVEAGVTDACGQVAEDALGVVLWTPEDLCATDPPVPALPELGTGSDAASFAPLLPGQALEVGDGGDDGALRLGLRLTGEPSPLSGGALLDEVVVEAGSVVVAASEPQAIEPSTWTPDTAWYLDVLVPFLPGGWPGAGEPIHVRATLHDACGRALQADVDATLAP